MGHISTLRPCSFRGISPKTWRSITHSHQTSVFKLIRWHEVLPSSTHQTHQRNRATFPSWSLSGSCCSTNPSYPENLAGQRTGTQKTPRFMQGSNLKPLPYQTCAQSFISPVKQWCSAQPFCSLLQHHCFFESDHPGTVAPVEHRSVHEIFCWKAPWSQLEKPAWQSLGQAVLLRFALDSKQKMKHNLTCREESENAKPAVMKRIMIVMMKMIMTTIVIMTAKMIIIIRNP